MNQIKRSPYRGLKTAKRKHKILQEVIIYGLDIKKYCRWLDIDIKQPV